MVLNPEEWRKLAKRFDLDEDSNDSLADQKLHAHLLKGIRGTLKDCPGYAKIRRIIVVREPWTVDNGMLTPTLKVKRARVVDKFEESIKALYANGPDAHA